MSEEELSVHITDVSTKFHSISGWFQTKEAAGNSSWKYVNESRRTFRVADCIWEELNVTNICDGKRATKQHIGVFPFISIAKEQIAKARSLGIKVCVLGRHKLWHFFFGKTLSTTEITPPCSYKKDWKFSWEIWLAKVHTFSENRLAFFFCRFRGGNKKFAEIRAGSLSCLVALLLHFALVATPRTLLLQCEPARRLG